MRSVEAMRKCRKPSQEDPAAVGPTQEQQREPGEGNPSLPLLSVMRL